jgi:formylglycine-generating enzyme required for sulfatase activity
MGASPGDDEASGDGNPAREVTLTKGLWALSTPVTQAMYKAVMGENPSAFKTVEKEETYEVTEGAWLFKQTVERTRKIEVENWKAPVENVSWYDAVEFCNRLSKKAGLSPAYRIVKSSEKWDEKGEVEWLQESEGYRLPTEAEWENLCRAGTTGSRYGELEEVAWYSGNSDKQTHPVGQKAPNAWGFYDTLGNVWEWCMDESDAEAYSKLPQVNPAHVPHTVDERVGRGGSWDDDAWYARASYRDWDYATYRSNNLGFRVLRTPRVKAKP